MAVNLYNNFIKPSACLLKKQSALKKIADLFSDEKRKDSTSQEVDNDIEIISTTQSEGNIKGIEIVKNNLALLCKHRIYNNGLPTSLQYAILLLCKLNGKKENEDEFREMLNFIISEYTDNNPGKDIPKYIGHITNILKRTKEHNIDIFTKISHDFDSNYVFLNMLQYIKSDPFSDYNIKEIKKQKILTAKKAIEFIGILSNIIKSDNQESIDKIIEESNKKLDEVHIEISNSDKKIVDTVTVQIDGKKIDKYLSSTLESIFDKFADNQKEILMFFTDKNDKKSALKKLIQEAKLFVYSENRTDKKHIQHVDNFNFELNFLPGLPSIYKDSTLLKNKLPENSKLNIKLEKLQKLINDINSDKNIQSDSANFIDENIKKYTINGNINNNIEYYGEIKTQLNKMSEHIFKDLATQMINPQLHNIIYKNENYKSKALVFGAIRTEQQAETWLNKIDELNSNEDNKTFLDIRFHGGIIGEKPLQHVQYMQESITSYNDKNNKKISGLNLILQLDKIRFNGLKEAEKIKKLNSANLDILYNDLAESFKSIKNNNDKNSRYIATLLEFLQKNKHNSAYYSGTKGAILSSIICITINLIYQYIDVNPSQDKKYPQVARVISKGCKSAKDRAGVEIVINNIISYLIIKKLHSTNTGDDKLDLTKLEAYVQENASSVKEILLGNSNAEVTRLNTGLPGNKNISALMPFLKNLNIVSWFKKILQGFSSQVAS